MRVVIVLTSIQEVILTPGQVIPRTIVADGSIEARLTVTIHIISMCVGDLTFYACTIFPSRVTSFLFRRESFFYIARIRIVNGQAVLHKESIYQALVYAQATTASIFQRNDFIRIKLKVIIIIILGIREQYLAVAILERSKPDVLQRRKSINSSVVVVFLIQLIAGTFSLIYQHLASFGSTHPLVGVISRAEQVFAFPVLMAGIPLITVDQGAGSKKQHLGTDGQCHNRSNSSIFLIGLPYGR